MKVGAEPKKMAALGGLLAIAAIALYINVFSSDEQPAARPAAQPVAAAPAPRPVAAGKRTDARVRKPAAKATGEFRPKMGTAEGEDKPDPASVDPALHLDLLAKLLSVELLPAGRNLFQYGTASAPPAPPPSLPLHPPTIPITNNTPPVTAPPSGAPPQPPPTPVNFKYYGFKTLRSNGVKQAFLLDGEDIIIAGENEIVKKRYRVVRIGVASIVVEDMEGKGQQTIQIEGQPTA